MIDMLTVSSLPGLPDLAPVKPDVSGGGGFAPLIARLLGGEIKVDCISLPPGGEMLPVSIPVTVPTRVSLSADAPAVPPAILVVPGSPSLVDHDEPPAASPVAVPNAPVPGRFAPVAVPAALAASPAPATDPVPPSGPPTAPTDAIDEPRAATGITRAALLTSAATPPPAATRLTIDPPAPGDGPVKRVDPVRKGAATEPAFRAIDDDPQPTAAPAPDPMQTVAPEVAQLVVAPVVVPAPLEPPPAMPTATAPIAAPRVLVARPTTRAVAAAHSTEQPPTREVATDSALAAVRQVTTPTTPAVVTAAAESVEVPERRQTPAVDPAPRPMAETSPLPAPPAEMLDRPTSAVRMSAPAPTIEPGPSVLPDPVSGSRPIVAAVPLRTAPTIAAALVAPVATAAQPIAPAPASAAHGTPAITPSLDGGAVVTPLVGADSPMPAADTVPAVAADVMAHSTDRPRREAPATERGSPAATPAPATPQAAAPVILPALQAFGAAIRRAMADERKPVASGDDTILGVPTLAGTTAPVPAQSVSPGGATLDTADRRWPHAMAEQIEKLRDAADSQSTRIRLLPDALGPVDVAVRRDGDQVHVHFAAADAQTRQLLADAQPRLADAAEARGLKLGRTDVSGGDLTGGDRQQQQRSAPHGQQPSRPAPAPARAATADTDDSRLA